jgi:hypothetical protein
MKKLFLLTALCSLILAGCTTEETKECTNPLKGVWAMQYAKFSYGDTTWVWEAGDVDKQTKIFTKEHWAYINLFAKEDELLTAAGSGTYCLKGDTLTEHFEIMADKGSLGASVSYFIKIKGDTLIQKGPIEGTAPGSWGDFQLKEVYIRME